MKLQYQPQGVCCKLMNIDVEDDKIKDVEFIGGCNGNLKAVSKLIQGMDLNTVISKLSGVDCGNKGTSCTDQLAKCLTKLKEGQFVSK